MIYYQIIRADGSSKNYKIFSEMLDDFDRQYVVDLHRAIRHKDTCVLKPIHRIDRSPYGVLTKQISIRHMEPLPPRDQRHLWLRYQVEGYTEEIVHDFEDRLETIFRRQVNRVHVLDFEGLTLEMRQDLVERLRMVYTGDDGQEIFAPEKVTATNLFYLCSMDQGAANVPYLLAQYLFRHAEGRKSYARLLGGHFIGCVAHHFGLVSDNGLRGLSVVTRELPLIDMGELVKLNIFMEVGDGWAWVAQGTERQPVAMAAALGGAEDALDIDEGAQAVPAPIHAPPPPPPDTGRTMP
ncbi:hypothetical protein Tco_0916488 [Tanacetum coccineum]